VSELTPLRRNCDFVLLQAGQLFSSFGSNMSRIAYPLLALAVTHSAADAGYVSAMVFVPMLAFNLLAGVAADRFERRRLMIAADVVAAAALAALAGAVVAGAADLWLILVVAAVDSTAGVFFRAGSRGRSARLCRFRRSPRRRVSCRRGFRSFGSARRRSAARCSP
jgi:MFS family permease